MNHLEKGSPAALAWAEKMRKKKLAIRAAGLRTEAQFFGPGGEFEDEARAKARTNPTGGPFDKDAARELELYATNNADLYRQMETPIRLNLEKKYKKGIYQSALAVKLWQGWADEAAKRYNKEFGGGGSQWFDIFSPATRRHVAQEQEAFHKGEMELGNFQVTAKKNPEGRVLGHAKPKQNKRRGFKPYYYWEWMGLSPQTGGTNLYQAPRQAGLVGAKKFDDGVYIDFQTGVVFTKTTLNPKKKPYLKYKYLSSIKDVPTRHMLKIAYDTVKHPAKALLGGPSLEEAQEILRRHGVAEPKNNPITLNGNPPARINTGIAGVLYNRCVEIRAEKTTKGKISGLYYHPFLERSKVCILALDNGDLLIHSKAGEKLWRLD
jgi:hypothetical protein